MADAEIAGQLAQGQRPDPVGDHHLGGPGDQRRAQVAVVVPNGLLAGGG